MKDSWRISILFLIVMFSQSIRSFSQFTVSGSVKDSSGKVVTASVSVIYRQSQAGIAFSRTDAFGKFSFTLEDSLDINLLAVRVVAVGFERSIQPVTTRNAGIDFILEHAIKKLPDVTVTNAPSAVKTKGDTLSYLVAAFSNANDRSINDVLKRIPGVEVDENNVIRYQGQPINHLYVDGDDMLDSKYQFATKAIKPETVERAEVIQNNQHIKMLNGILPSTSPAVNLTIKEKNRFIISNSAELAVGSHESVKAGFNSLAFKPKLKFINTAQYNNTGEALAALVGTGAGAGLSTLAENTGVGELLLFPSAIVPGVPRWRFLNNHSSLANINDFIKTKNEFTWKVNAYLVHEKQNQQVDEFTSYYLPNDTLSYLQYQQVHNERTLFRASVTTEINTLQRYMNNVFTFDRNASSNVSGIFTGAGNINQQMKGSATRVSDAFNTIGLLRNKKFLEFSAFISYENKPQDLVVSPGLQPDILNNNTPYLAAMQQVEIPVFFTHIFVTYRSNKGILLQSYKAGVVTQQAKLNSYIRVEQTNHAVTEANDSLFSNDLNWTRNKVYVESSYFLRMQKLSVNINLPVAWQYIHYNNPLFDNGNTARKFLFTPTLGMEYKIGYESILRAGYSYNAQFTGMNEIYQGAVLRNYQTLVASNPRVQPVYNRNATAGIEIKRPLKFFLFRVDGFYYERYADFIQSVTLRNNVIATVSAPLHNTSYTSGISMSAAKFVYSVKTNFSIRYSWDANRSVQLQNALLFPVNTYSHKLGATASWKPGSFISAGISSSQNWLVSEQPFAAGKELQEQRVRQSQHSFECSIFPVTGFSVKLSSEYNDLFESGEKRASAFFADFRSQYKFPHKDLMLEIAFTNITNQQRFTTIYTSQNSLTTVSQSLRPRMILASMYITL
jgi:hypothetical protein